MAQQDVKAKVAAAASCAMLSLALSLAAVGLSNRTWWSGSLDEAEIDPSPGDGADLPNIDFSITLWEYEMVFEDLGPFDDFMPSHIPGTAMSLPIDDWCSEGMDDEWCSQMTAVRVFVFLEFFAVLLALVCNAVACAFLEVMPRAITGAFLLTAVVSTGFASLCALIAVSVAGSVTAEIKRTVGPLVIRLDLSLSGVGFICTVLSLVLSCLCCLPGLAVVIVCWWRAARAKASASAAAAGGRAAGTVSRQGPAVPEPPSQGLCVMQ
jgi:hypothetical protein